MVRTALLTGILMGLAACIDVQSVRQPSGTGGGGGAGTSAGMSGASGSWTGYVEQYSFRSGSTTLNLTFSTNAQGVAVGTILFGQGVPPPPATDPTVGYPPDFLAQATADRTLADSPWFYIAEGYAYTFDGGMLEGQRLQFTVNLSQLWSDWWRRSVCTTFTS